MADSTPAEVSAAVAAEATRSGHPLEPAQIARLARLVSLLAHWAQRIRLTGSAEPAALIQRHLADALVLAASLPRQGPQPCLDVGSGGGLPALPTAILRPELRITLVEPRQRKCAFLRAAIHELELGGCQVLQQRLEALALQPQAVAWSLATFPPEDWLRRALPLLQPGGLAAVFLVRPELAPSLPRGLRPWATQRYVLADGSPRCLLLLRREADDG